MNFITTNISKVLLLSTLCWGMVLIWYITSNVMPSLVSDNDSVISKNAIQVTIADAPILLLPASQYKVSQLEIPKKPIIGKPMVTKPDTTSTSDDEDGVWNSISRDLKLDHQADSAKVKSEVKKILAEQGKFNSILKAAGPYIYYIFEQTKMKGLPAEVALIPIIESEFNPNDRSSVGATGLWQLMSGTAHELGVIVKGGYDGRRNVIASTRAALLYFNDLGKNFKGNWYLAFAAYNMGQGGVEKAVRRAGSQIFWNLSLPKETQYYIPKLLAVAEIIKNPEKYGVTLPPISNEPYFAELKTKKSVDLSELSNAVGAPLDALRALNPDYKNGNVQPKNGVYTLLVPLPFLSKVEVFLKDNVIS